MYIRVKVKANSKKEFIEKKSENSFDISVREKAEKNMANKRVIEIIALQFGVSVNRVRIINGHHTPVKLLAISV